MYIHSHLGLSHRCIAYTLLGRGDENRTRASNCHHYMKTGSCHWDPESHQDTRTAFEGSLVNDDQSPVASDSTWGADSDQGEVCFQLAVREHELVGTNLVGNEIFAFANNSDWSTETLRKSIAQASEVPERRIRLLHVEGEPRWGQKKSFLMSSALWLC